MRAKQGLILWAVGVAEAFQGGNGVALLGRPMPGVGSRAWATACPPAPPPAAPLGLCLSSSGTMEPACPRAESMATTTCVVATRHAGDVASGTMADALRRRAEWVKLDDAQGGGDLYQCSKNRHVFLWVSLARLPMR